MKKKIIVTGAAGLVGQNLIVMLAETKQYEIIALDKNAHNLAILKNLHPEIKVVHADLAVVGEWIDEFAHSDYAVILHAQITGLEKAEFIKNNIQATENVIHAIQKHAVPYTVHISSSVVNSVAKDNYTETKTLQEQLVLKSGIKCCVLRPTLMFGWFDPKHLGWLARFMQKTPVFPIPGHGRYLRQPLYSRDFCRIILAALQQQPVNRVYDIVGNEQINYIDIIKIIKKTTKSKTIIARIPYALFLLLLKIYSLISKRPPFTADQLKALTAGDFFVGVDAKKEFGVELTSFTRAIEETFTHPDYSKVVLTR